MFCVVLVACTFILLIAGGLVTSNDAGLSVPDWPLSYGRWMPDMVGGIFYEHGHRMIAAAVGLLTLILNGLLFLLRADRRLKRLGLIALVAVLLQGILGGLTVLFELPVLVSVLHASLAQVFFCLVVSLALFTSSAWPPPAPPDEGEPPPVKYRTARLLTLTLFAQLILGALLRHSGTVDGVKATKLDLWALAGHLAGALAVVTLIVAVAFPVLRGGSTGPVARSCGALLGLGVGQLGLGVAALLIRLGAVNRVQPMPVDAAVTTAHLGVGALMLAISLTVTLWCRPSHGSGMETTVFHPDRVL